MTEQTLEIEGFRLRVLKTVSEGGFGFVYLVENENRQGGRMALKKIIVQDEERYRIAWKELNFLKTYCAQPSSVLINYLASKVVEESPTKYCFYILIEYCANGTLFDLMAVYMQKNQRFSEEEILVLLRAANACLVALHGLGIIHCDFKIENLLFFNWESIKLCDFGSVNNFNIDFSQVPRQQFYNYETLFEKQTTMMYRPPEMCDLYLGFRVNNKVDMWMLGCVLFTLMFFKHPFHESTKLSIVNASYYWPEDSPYSAKLECLTRNLLTPNPELRPTALEVKNLLDNWDQIGSIELNKMALGIKQASQRMRSNLPSQPQARLGGGSQSGTWLGVPKPDTGFDFSGLERLSKQAPDARGGSGVNRRPMGKLNSFNFMNLDFGEPEDPQQFRSKAQSRSEQTFNAGPARSEPVNFDPFEALAQPKSQPQPAKDADPFDPFNINFPDNN